MRHVRVSALLYALLIAVTCMPKVYSEAAELGYRIDDLRFDVVGRTNIYLLSRTADITVGSVFPDRLSLEAYIADRRQVLLNERVLESVEIDILEMESTPDHPVPVTLIVRTRDTWNIIALPYFKFDSNSGLLFSIRARDYNFWGSMEPLRFNLNLDRDLSDATTLSADMNFSMPFTAWGRDLTWNFNASVTIPPSSGLDVGLSSDIELAQPIVKAVDLYFTIGQALQFNDRDSIGVLYDDPFYTTTNLSLSVPVTLYDIGRFGKLRYSPSISLAFNWNHDGIMDSDLKGPSLNASHGLSFGRVDWVGNFQSGIEASTSISLAYNFYTMSSTKAVSFETSAYYPYRKNDPWAGIKGRVSGFYRFDDLNSTAGNEIRGILNSRIVTDTMLYANLDMPVRLIRFNPAKWFGVPWMRYFEFDQHWSPFVDIALVHDTASGRYFSLTDTWLGGGIEVITFPKVMRSMYVRISAEWDLRGVYELKSLTGSSPRDGRGIWELFIGLGHHY